MNEENKQKKNISIAIGAIVIIGVVLVTILSSKNSQNSNNTPNTPTNVPIENPTPITKPIVTTPPSDIPKKSASVYKDGTYSATGSYMSPGGQDQIGITLTLSKDIITDISATNGAGDGTSSRYENKFISGYKAYVVGKNIANVYLTRVSGSSLTPQGFNDALAQIKTQAKA